MKQKISPTVRKKLKALASSLLPMVVEIEGKPVSIRRRGKGWARKATNHHKKLTEAYEEGGRAAVKAYVKAYQREYELYLKEIINQPKDAIKWTK